MKCYQVSKFKIALVIGAVFDDLFRLLPEAAIGDVL